MTDKYKVLRDALDAEPTAWISQNTMTGVDRYARVPIQSLQPGVYKHTPLYCIDPETIRALLAERDALREALVRCSRVLAGEEMSKSSLMRALEAAQSALAQHQGEKHGN